MIQRLLIANRGEIACRIILSCKKLNIQTVAVFSMADENSLHTKLADEAYFLGASHAQESYLNIDKIIEIAKKYNCDAIHPGYGFLAENANFARTAEDNNIIFVGPSSTVIAQMGNKIQAKSIMQAAGVATIPGYYGNAQTSKQLQQHADKIGYPLLIKAAGGGGGKGMRIVDCKTNFTDSLASAKREAKSSFNDSTILLEKYLPTARHIEVQIIADNYGNILHCHERDCSIQRRYQKIILLSSAVRAKLAFSAKKP